MTELTSDKIHSSLFSMHLVMQIVSDMYCGVSTPLGCAVVLARAMLGYLCKLLDEGGTKKWKITKILDSPIAA